MHGIYCHRYYQKYVRLVADFKLAHLDILCRNREKVNEKTRERMRRLRATDTTVPPEVLAERVEKRRAAQARYREKCVFGTLSPGLADVSCRNQWKLKMKAREVRADEADHRIE